MIIGRHRLGIKPHYYAVTDGNLVFASELKSLLVLPGFSAALDHSALSEYLMVGNVPTPQSIIAGVKRLAPGTLLVSEKGELREINYWSVKAVQQKKDAEWEEDYNAA